ncbi:MAG: hypothetical protein ACOCWV_05925 [Planctomycetota bacterium]
MNGKRFALVALLTSAAVVVGCDKKVEVTFVNTSSQDLEIEWAEQGIAGMPLGTVHAGSKMKHTVKEDKDMLPTWFQWSAGDGQYSGKVSITEDTPGKLWVDIVEQRLRNANVELKETRKIETDPIPIYEDTVVD